MRILLIPNISSKDLATDSVGLSMSNWITEAVEKDANLWFYVLLPKGLFNYRVFDLPHTTVVWENRKYERFYREISMMDLATVVNLFSMKKGVYQIDAVVTHKVGCALQLQRLLADERYVDEKEYLKIPVIILEDRAWARGDTHQFVDWQEFSLRALAYGTLKSVVHTQFERDEIVDASKQYLSDDLLCKLKKNIEVMPLGINVDKVMTARLTGEKRPKFTVFWGGRMSAQKRFSMVIEQFLKLYEGGRDIDIVLTTPHIRTPEKVRKEMMKLEFRFKGLKIEHDVGREEYLRKCVESHAWMSGSMFEGWSVGMVEMMATGIPGVVPRRNWSEELFGKDYRYFYETEEEAALLLRWIYDNYEEAVKIGEQMGDAMIRQYDSKVFIDRFIGKIRDITDENRGLSGINVDGQVSKAVDVVIKKLHDDNKKSFSLSEFWSEMKKMGFGKDIMEGYGMALPSNWDFRQHLFSKGVTDTCASEFTEFKL